jgi:hypothetical protein
MISSLDFSFGRSFEAATGTPLGTRISGPDEDVAEDADFCFGLEA